MNLEKYLVVSDEVKKAIKEGKPVAGIIRIFCGWFVWVCDLIMMIIKGSILRVLNC